MKSMELKCQLADPVDCKWRRDVSESTDEYWQKPVERSSRQLVQKKLIKFRALPNLLMQFRRFVLDTG